MKKTDPKVIKLDDFVVHSANPKFSPIQSLIRHIAREVNRHKLNYRQLKYVFKSVRERCEIEVPTSKGRRLLELPSVDDLNRFYAGIKDPVHRLIFEFLEGTGVRVDEMCSLEVKRLDLDRNEAFIFQGKGKKDRIIVIGRGLADKLALYLKGRTNRYLFESNRNSRFSTRRIEQLCKEYRAKAGIEADLTPHTWRHLFNTKMAEAGVPEEKRAILVGHDDAKGSQRIYTHLGVAGIKDEVLAILDKVGRK